MITKTYTLDALIIAMIIIAGIDTQKYIAIHALEVGVFSDAFLPTG